MPLVEEGEGVSREELQLAARNHGMPLEALRYPLTPLGLHYLLIHYDIPAVDEDAWRLEVDGAVRTPLSLSLRELRSFTPALRTVTMECAGNGRAQLEPRPISQPWLVEAVGTAAWRGVDLAALLERAGVGEGAIEVLFTGLDRGVEGGVEQSYQRSIPIGEDALLAYEINGEPLPPQHGFPLRLVVPGWYGMTNVKWLGRITVLTEPFDGYQHERAYRFRTDEDEVGEPVTRMVPRSLMVPPGIPDFMTRTRFAKPGSHRIVGRAWSGRGRIESVDVSADAGATWQPAVLGGQDDRFSWRGWSFDWQAEPGEHVLCCRARDDAGNEQPLEPPWNLGGYANNSVQCVPVRVG
jgi:DMSO/TMAO reductase YedYZ molybdopterin-dependent catalytic subunit